MRFLSNPFAFTVLLAGFICLSTCSSLPAQETDFQQYSNTLEFENGFKVNRRYSRVEVFDKEGEAVKMERPSVSHTHVALFPDPSSEDHFLAITTVTSRNTGLALLRYSLKTGKLEELIRTHERLRPSQLRFLQLENGDIVVISNQGVLLQFRDRVHVDRYAIDGFYQSPNKMFRPINGLVAGSKIYFYSMIESGYEGKALRDVIVFEDNQFRKVDLNGAAINSAQRVENKLQFMSDKGFFNIDLETGETKLTIAKLPTLNGEQLQLVNSFAPESGKPIGLFQRPWSQNDFHEIEQFDDGYLIRIGEMVDGQWELTDLGLESSIRKWKQNFCEQSNGRVWLTPTHSGRIIVREPDGKFRRLAAIGDLDGKPLSKISINQNSQLQAWDASVSLIYAKPIEELLSAKPKEYSDWETLRLRTPLIPCGKGNLYAISMERGGALLQIVDGKMNYFKLPPANQYARNGFTYISADTDGNVWLFHEQQSKTAVWEDGRWTVFENKTMNGETLTHKQVAFQDRAQKVKDRSDYQIGFSGYFIVRFAKGAQVVFKNRQNRVAYFDGENWHAPTAGRERGYRYASDPFIFKNLVCYVDRNEVVGMTRGKFLEMENVTDKRPWRTVPMSKTLRRRYSIGTVSWKPESPDYTGSQYPYGQNWHYESDSKTDQLGIALPDRTWTMVQKTDTPLEKFRQSFLIAAQKDLFVFRGKQGANRSNTADRNYYAKRFNPVAINQGKKDLGQFANPTAMIQLPLITNPPNRPAHIRFRINDGEWSLWNDISEPIELPELEEPGQYTLEVHCNFDEDLVITEPLIYTFQFTPDESSTSESGDENSAKSSDG
jgi:hypothetical protein